MILLNRILSIISNLFSTVFANPATTIKAVVRIQIVVEVLDLARTEAGAEPLFSMAWLIAAGRFAIFAMIELGMYEYSMNSFNSAIQPSSKGGRSISFKEWIPILISFLIGIMVTSSIWVFASVRFGLNIMEYTGLVLDFRTGQFDLFWKLTPKPGAVQDRLALAMWGMIYSTPFLTVMYGFFSQQHSKKTEVEEEKEEVDDKPIFVKTTEKEEEDSGFSEKKLNKNAQAYCAKLGLHSLEDICQKFAETIAEYLETNDFSNTVNLNVKRMSGIAGADFDDLEDYLYFYLLYHHTKRDNTTKKILSSSKFRDKDTVARYFYVFDKHKDDGNKKGFAPLRKSILYFNASRTKYEKFMFDSKDFVKSRKDWLDAEDITN